MCIWESLRRALAKAIVQATALNQEQIFSLIEKPKNKDFGDLAFPCFSLAKDWKASPPECARRLKAELELPEGFSHAEIKGPYLNFFFDRGFFTKCVLDHTLSSDAFPTPALNKTVLVEYSSPNIAKPFHVGHLRATLIGNCLDRLYRKLGWNTISVNHLGDWGTQFGFVWAGCKLWGMPDEPTVGDLVALYRRATGLKETQENEKGGKEEEEEEVSEEENPLPEVNELARSYFIALERGEDYAVSFWKQCVEISLEYLKKTYERLDISFDHYIGESFYSDKLDAVRSSLEEAGILIESKGALGVDLGEQIGFARIFTPDGRSLYLTRDIAAAIYRKERFNYDKSIYVVGAPQTLHFKQLVGVLEALGKPYAQAINHVAFGHVLGMKTRGAGNFIELNDFLDEAYEKALEAYHTQVSKRPEGLDERLVAERVALAAIIFSNLSRNNIKDVHFSWKHALEFQGDTGPYLLYARARINGIKEKAEAAGLSVKPDIAVELLSEESAYQLISIVSEFEGTLKKTAQDNEPCYLAAYALDLAKAFSRAYQDLKVVGEEKSLAEARLTLFEAARQVLGSSLSLMGIEPLERM